MIRNALREERDVLLRECERLRYENERLTGWLERIDGGDRPCDDATILRGWAYQALTEGAHAKTRD